MRAIAQLGARTVRSLGEFGEFCSFSGRAGLYVASAMCRWRNLKFLLDQFYAVGTRSVPVVMITGAFIGMVLAVQTVMQFKQAGLEGIMGSVINLSVLRELGPVLAGVMLAGRIGGAFAAELGTMRVTEQIDALRAMGTDPIRVLVAPRLLACVVLGPVLVMYTAFTGILGGYVISVYIYNVNAGEFWAHAQDSVMLYDIFYGPIKAAFFGAALALISCHKGFHCRPGAAGVGRACMEAFVYSCLVILGLNFFLDMLLNTIQEMVFGLRMVI